MTGDDLRAFRDRWGLSRAELVRRLDVDYSTVWRWEKAGTRELPQRVALAISGLERELEQERAATPRSLFHAH